MVTLSGGDKGGEQVDGSGWRVGTVKTFDGLKYRRVSEEQAVFVGVV